MKRLPALILSTTCLFGTLHAGPEMKTESFDKSPRDWRGRGVSANWSDSNFAAGANQGEAGIQPNGTSNRVIYADMDIHALNLDMPFEAIIIPDVAVSGGMLDIEITSQRKETIALSAVSYLP